ncbi:hypothetical protein ACRXCV_08680 [Halobacteriovorax sp. GFR7]|uniref:hypothetical protein n=1 Tax=unclassified Halobacteriovorax TaxID=2639665 RepID=UPI003D997071
MKFAVRIVKNKKELLHTLGTLGCISILATSCVVDQASSSREGSGGSALSNTQDTVSANYGRVLTANPLVLSDYTADENTDLSTLITRSPVYITSNEYLTKSCSLIGDCLEVTEDAGVSAFQNESRKWAFPVTTTEFLQINAFYHTAKVIDTYLGDVTTYVFDRLNQVSYDTAVPTNTDLHKAYWNASNKAKLVVHADASLRKNASFDPSNFLIKLGYIPGYQNIKMAQDPSVIYHEFGHAIVDRLMNHRNRAFNAAFCLNTQNPICLEESALGYFGHDEAYSINEGIADYFSYFTNDREHMGEWGLGKFANASRPISENDSMHIAGISTDEDSRLSYPEYLGYDVYSKEARVDDIHVDGQIISHLLVALTKELSNRCTGNIDDAKKLVFYALVESLGELGDLSAQAKDGLTGQINLDQDYAKEWLKSVNPINFRRFSQSLARNVYNITNSQYNLCTYQNFSKDNLEQLFDSYGLLLFRTYNNNFNSISTTNITVNPLNRKKTELINKNLLVKDTRSSYSSLSVFDIRSSVYQTIQNQMDVGEVTTVDARYNNGNGKVSPGEIVGLFVSVYNNSSSIMAGTRVLASDWAHMQDGVPCSNLSDGYPSISQGGKTCDPLTETNYNDTGRIMPVCMLTYNDGTSTKLLNQHEFLKRMKSDIGLLEKDCLGQGEDRTQDDLNNCFVKAIPSTNVQNIPFMAPKSNWQETMQAEQGAPLFTDSNIMFFEINKNIPLGTEVSCRLRMTFANCEDCYHDLTSTNYDDFKDFEFAGEEPFSILNINFTIEQ